MTEGLLTPKEAAHFLKLSVRQLQRIAIHRVRFGRLVRYRQDDLERYVQLHVEGPSKRRSAA
jgi:hypothetical protein